MKRPTIEVLVCVTWLTLISAGAVTLLNYENTPGLADVTPQQWPSDAAIALDPLRPTLVMFAHPQCPCTRASINELNRLLARSQGRVTTHVLFLKPDSETDEWTHSDSWRAVAAIPGVSVAADRNGAVAARFGAETSGYVVLYDRQGQLLFKGGITSARAHAGDNAGANMIVSMLAGTENKAGQTPVYGCSLLDTCVAPSQESVPWPP